MRRTAALAAAAALALSGCSGAGSSDADGPGGAGGGDEAFVPGDGSITFREVGERTDAPAVEASTLDGGTLSLAELEGDVVVLNFWASWCAPCRAEADDLERVAEQTADEGVQVVGVNIRDRRTAAESFVRTQGVGYPNLVDERGEITVAFSDLRPAAVPTTIVVDRQGRLAARVLGGVTDEQLLPVVRRVAEEPADGTTA